MVDYEALVALFDELDEVHRLARPDVFRRFDGRRAPDFAGAVPPNVIELDNLVVHSGWRSQGIGRQLIEATVDWSRGRGATTAASPCMPSTAMPTGSTKKPALRRRSTGLRSLCDF